MQLLGHLHFSHQLTVPKFRRSRQSYEYANVPATP